MSAVARNVGALFVACFLYTQHQGKYLKVGTLTVLDIQTQETPGHKILSSCLMFDLMCIMLYTRQTMRLNSGFHSVHCGLYPFWACCMSSARISLRNISVANDLEVTALLYLSCAGSVQQQCACWCPSFQHLLALLPFLKPAPDPDWWVCYGGVVCESRNVPMQSIDLSIYSQN